MVVAFNALGASTATVKFVLLIPVPAAVVTLMGPVTDPAGTFAVIDVSETNVKLALVPLNFTAVAPVKLEPVIVTLVPTSPLVGEKLVIDADGIGVSARL